MKFCLLTTQTFAETISFYKLIAVPTNAQRKECLDFYLPCYPVELRRLFLFALSEVGGFFFCSEDIMFIGDDVQFPPLSLKVYNPSRRIKTIRLAPVEGERARFTVGFRRNLLKANGINEKRLFGTSQRLANSRFPFLVCFPVAHRAPKIEQRWTP